MRWGALSELGGGAREEVTRVMDDIAPGAECDKGPAVRSACALRSPSLALPHVNQDTMLASRNAMRPHNATQSAVEVEPSADTPDASDDRWTNRATDGQTERPMAKPSDRWTNRASDGQMNAVPFGFATRQPCRHKKC
ncbi:unnamed protein product [Lota lota]